MQSEARVGPAVMVGPDFVGFGVGAGGDGGLTEGGDGLSLQ